jgi:hypothetical protein
MECPSESDITGGDDSKVHPFCYITFNFSLKVQNISILSCSYTEFFFQGNYN